MAQDSKETTKKCVRLAAVSSSEETETDNTDCLFIKRANELHSSCIAALAEKAIPRSQRPASSAAAQQNQQPPALHPVNAPTEPPFPAKYQVPPVAPPFTPPPAPHSPFTKIAEREGRRGSYRAVIPLRPFRRQSKGFGLSSSPPRLWRRLLLLGPPRSPAGLSALLGGPEPVSEVLRRGLPLGSSARRLPSAGAETFPAVLPGVLAGPGGLGLRAAAESGRSVVGLWGL